jgi:soluble lytic murein transglycosylase-like protein
MCWAIAPKSPVEMPMPPLPRRTILALTLLPLAACSAPNSDDAARADLYPNETPELRRQIEHYAAVYGVPVDLVQRVVIRESRHNPKAQNGPYMGLMQIHPQTAQTMGYRGTRFGLLDADTNLRYGVKYLRGAWLVAAGDPDAAIGWYARGYYYEAKRMGLLEETGLLG